ncbi:MAG: 4-alpha-glucanotransferase [Pseudomonadota bacterium]
MNPLDKLCAHYGVYQEYYTIWGEHHPTSERTKRAILGAMGIAAEDDAAVERSLREYEDRHWRRLLPPVMVVRESSGPCRILLGLPAAFEQSACHWRLRTEFGQELEGEFVPAGLEEAGRRHQDGQEQVRRILVLDLPLETGYHRLRVDCGNGLNGEMPLIVAPHACYTPPAIQGNRRSWGFAAQLYGLRSTHNWGMGDFSDLRALVEFCADASAGTLLLNPLHALFPDAPEHASPYSPSSRVWFNTLYLDVEAVDDFAECAAAQEMAASHVFQQRLGALRASAEVDYAGVAAAKREMLELLYRHFRKRHLEPGSERGRAFRAFQSEHGESLRRLAEFEALQEYFHGGDEAAWGWPSWPETYRNPQAAEVAAFAEANLERVEYYEYLQWQTFLQLEAAGRISTERGLGIGIMLDLAIGVAEGGAATWTRPELHALSASAGAPPDEINLLGQDWGLPPWIPHKLTEAAYEPFIELLRTNMRFAGALRIDHVMGLYRLFWVVRGFTAVEGCYVSYPFEDLLGILALESQRNRCLVVGEDLGTVPDEVRHALHPAGVLSTRVLYFERRDDGRMKPPHDYPAQAAATVTTHDLPTLAGFWRGLDIELRERLQLFPSEEVRDRQIAARNADRIHLLQALEVEGLLPAGGGAQPESFPDMTPELAQAVYAYLARSPSKLLLVQMEDGLGVAEQPNLPGTTEAVYPCWRLKLPAALEDWRENNWLQGIIAALRRQRP